MKKLNILYITHEGAIGGAGVALLAMIDEMLQKEHTIYVAIPFKNAKMVDELRKRKVCVIPVFFSWWEYPVKETQIKKIIFKILYRFNGISLYRLKRKIKNLKIDIIHSNSSVIDIGAKLALTCEIPHIWHIREYMEGTVDFIKNKQKCLKFFEKSNSQFIVISKALYEAYKECLPSNNVCIIPDGVDPKHRYQKRRKNIHYPIKFLISGTLQQYKGQDIAMKAAGILVKKGITDFTITIAGGDPYAYKEELLDIVDKNNIYDNISFLGYVNNIEEIRRGVDIELVCTVAEGFGLAAAESLMSSNPVIASNSGALPEIIKDVRNGLLFSMRDAKDLAVKMEYMIQHPEEIIRMSNNAYMDSMNDYGIEKTVSSIEKEYIKIIK